VLTRLSKLELLDTHGAGPQRFWKVSNAGGLLDLWAAEEQSGAQTTGLYVWSRSPQELLRKIPQLNQLNGRWALGGYGRSEPICSDAYNIPRPKYLD